MKHALFTLALSLLIAPQVAMASAQRPDATAQQRALDAANREQLNKRFATLDQRFNNAKPKLTQAQIDVLMPLRSKVNAGWNQYATTQNGVTYDLDYFDKAEKAFYDKLASFG